MTRSYASKDIGIIGAALLVCISLSMAQDPMNEQRMINHWHKRHPEMSVDLCRSMHQKIKNMTPEQQIALQT